MSLPRLPGYLVLLMLFSPVHATDLKQGYDLADAPRHDWGKIKDIVKGKPAYGREYVSPDGSYTFLLVRDWVVKQGKKGGIYFFGSSAKGYITCVVRRMTYRSGWKSFRDMQNAPEGPIRAALEREWMEHGGEQILSRDVYYLGGKKYKNLAPVKMLAWDIRVKKGVVYNIAAVETPANTYEFVCGGKPEVLSHSRLMIKSAFRLAEGAMVPQHTAAIRSESGDSFNQGVQAYNARDYRQAYTLWKPLADKGNPAAQYNIGVLYQRGHGVNQDVVQANQWWRKSANQNYPLAQSSLGLSYAIGRGLARDFEKAYMWISMAAKAGDSIARQALPKLEKSMTQKQLFNGKNKAFVCEQQLQRRFACD